MDAVGERIRNTERQTIETLKDGIKTLKDIKNGKNAFTYDVETFDVRVLLTGQTKSEIVNGWSAGRRIGLNEIHYIIRYNISSNIILFK